MRGRHQQTNARTHQVKHNNPSQPNKTCPTKSTKPKQTQAQPIPPEQIPKTHLTHPKNHYHLVPDLHVSSRNGLRRGLKNSKLQKRKCFTRILFKIVIEGRNQASRNKLALDPNNELPFYLDACPNCWAIDRDSNSSLTFRYKGNVIGTSNNPFLEAICRVTTRRDSEFVERRERESTDDGVKKWA